ncbi:MAG: hypothetical protein A4E35_00628 [Methanoregula sp. PtaU1.Bin051]|nr:MAG: hypothetical protein A4E35_00628 [Methanoregula sp. PtaU1.Bin051]
METREVHCRILLFCMVTAIIITGIILPVAAVDSLTRGSMFTISIAGKPNTPYHVWFTRTFAMTGEPGDQPPVIVGNTERVEFDPDGGPYVIGSYQYSGGNGKRIIDDVAPSSASVSNTRYYAKVTTDSDGFGIVQFSTSSATASKTFNIRAENPATGEEVPARIDVPEKKVGFVTTPTTVRQTTVPQTTAAVTSPPMTVPVITPVTTVPVTSGPMTSNRAAPDVGFVLIAVSGAGLLTMRRLR